MIQSPSEDGQRGKEGAAHFVALLLVRSFAVDDEEDDCVNAVKTPEQRAKRPAAFRERVTRSMREDVAAVRAILARKAQRTP